MPHVTHLTRDVFFHKPPLYVSMLAVALKVLDAFNLSCPCTGNGNGVPRQDGSCICDAGFLGANCSYNWGGTCVSTSAFHMSTCLNTMLHRPGERKPEGVGCCLGGVAGKRACQVRGVANKGARSIQTPCDMLLYEMVTTRVTLKI